MKLHNKITIVLFVSLSFFSCEKFVDIAPPRTNLVSESVFSDYSTAESAVMDIYYQMRVGDFASGGSRSFPFIACLSSDEMLAFSASQQYALFQQFNNNAILSNNSINTSLWSEPYQYIYKANAAIEALNGSTSIPVELRGQLIGECKFLRAFSYFYLLNLYGEVPLCLSTDYLDNKNNNRSSADNIFNQIVSDLSDASVLLSKEYSFSGGERVRANRGASQALLARVYLYKGDWANAEIQATHVIDDPLYKLEDLNNVFLISSGEAILQLWSDLLPRDVTTFYIFGDPVNGVLRESLVNAFGDGDLRRDAWISSINGYYFPTKYKSTSSGEEYSTVLRLSEQYLIRAEARARQNNLDGINSASSDLNAVRNRAGLENIEFESQTELLDSIIAERRLELFCEWGHRWLDLKRTGLVDEVMEAEKPAAWKPTASLYPIPESQILNSNVEQNPGY